MGADYYLVNKETKTKLNVMGRGVTLYCPEIVADFLLDSEDQEIMLVELNQLTDVENPAPYDYQPYLDYEVVWNKLKERQV